MVYPSAHPQAHTKVWQPAPRELWEEANWKKGQKVWILINFSVIFDTQKACQWDR